MGNLICFKKVRTSQRIGYAFSPYGRIGFVVRFIKDGHEISTVGVSVFWQIELDDKNYGAIGAKSS